MIQSFGKKQVAHSKAGTGGSYKGVGRSPGSSQGLGKRATVMAAGSNNNSGLMEQKEGENPAGFVLWKRPRDPCYWVPTTGSWLGS